MEELSRAHKITSIWETLPSEQGKSISQSPYFNDLSSCWQNPVMSQLQSKDINDTFLSSSPSTRSPGNVHWEIKLLSFTPFASIITVNWSHSTLILNYMHVSHGHSCFLNYWISTGCLCASVSAENAPTTKPVSVLLTHIFCHSSSRSSLQLQQEEEAIPKSAVSSVNKSSRTLKCKPQNHIKS